jgi:hypothetical protein
MSITSVQNPRWANESQSLIDCDITTDMTGSEVLPFTASPNDPESSGRAIFQACIDGAYGPIAAFVPPPPPPPPPAPTAEQNKQRAIDLLKATDWAAQPDVIDDSIHPHLINYPEFRAYRAALRGIAVNPLPGHLDWPSKPVEQWSA